MLSFQQFILEQKKKPTKSRKGHFSWETDQEVEIIKSPKKHTETKPPKKKLKEDLDHPSLSKEQIDSFHEHRKSFNPEHGEFLRRYKGASSRFNRSHRNKDSNLSAHYKEMTDHMDHVTSQKQSHPIEGYRGFSEKFGVHKLKPGDHFVDHGYTGMSLSKETAKQFADDIHEPEHQRHIKRLAHIHVSKGVKGHYLDLENNRHSSSHFLGADSEHEFLLHRGTKFRVGNHERDEEGNHIIHLHAEPQEEKEGK